MKEAYRVELTASVIVQQDIGDKNIEKVALAELLIALRENKKIAFEPRVNKVFITQSTGKGGGKKQG